MGFPFNNNGLLFDQLSWQRPFFIFGKKPQTHLAESVQGGNGNTQQDDTAHDPGAPVLPVFFPAAIFSFMPYAFSVILWG